MSLFLDANIPAYANGAPHELKEPCLSVIRVVANHPLRFVTDAEVLQELLHRYQSTRRWQLGRLVIADFAELMAHRIEPVWADDVLAATALAEEYPALQARDLIHAAVMSRLNVDAVVSTDRGFDSWTMERVDPTDRERLAELVTG